MKIRFFLFFPRLLFLSGLIFNCAACYGGSLYMRIQSIGSAFLVGGSRARNDGEHVSYDCIVGLEAENRRESVFENEVLLGMGGRSELIFSACVKRGSDLDGEMLVVRKTVDLGRTWAIVARLRPDCLGLAFFGTNEAVFCYRSELVKLDLISAQVSQFPLPTGAYTVPRQAGTFFYFCEKTDGGDILWQFNGLTFEKLGFVKGSLTSVVPRARGGAYVAVRDDSVPRQFRIDCLEPSGGRAVFVRENGVVPEIQNSDEGVLLTYSEYNIDRGLPRYAVVLEESEEGNRLVEKRRWLLTKERAVTFARGHYYGISASGAIERLP